MNNVRKMLLEVIKAEMCIASMPTFPERVLDKVMPILESQKSIIDQLTAENGLLKSMLEDKHNAPK